MHLYNATLQSTSAITNSIVGNFTGHKTQQILLARNTSLELLSIEPSTGQIHSLYHQPVFAIIRSLQAFRLTSTKKDYAVLGTDSGRIIILEYNESKNTFERVIMETFGKSGIRRIVPGEYLACDPAGRAIMIASIERSKFVYILNRTTEKILISSPLEAHKSNTICSSLVSLDVGFENPQFCSLEVDFEESDTDPTSKKYNEIEKVCVIWELDLGLNHVVKKKNIIVDRSAYLLVALPASPGGVLCFAEGLVTWVHEDYPMVSVNIPRRKDPLSLHERKEIIVSAVVHKLKKDFFVLMQTDLGDVFKLALDYIPGVMDGVKNIKVKYFETLNVSVALCLLKSGFLFSASEFGNHQLYQVENLGDDDTEQPIFDCQSLEGWFSPRGLRNLGLVDEIESMSPLLDACVANLTEEDTPQIYAICGKGSRSTFRILRHGLQVSEIAESELPGVPNAVWTVKTSNDDQYDSMIIISFVNATLCLSIGESVEEVSDTGILVTSPTLCVGQLGDDALVQIYPGGIRHIRSDRRVSEWKVPEGTHIVQGASNFRQVCVALSNTELVYFELDYSGNLNEFQERKELGSQVSSIALSPIPHGRQRALFLSLGCDDNTVRVLSLDPNNCLQSVSMQALSAPAESLALIEMVDPITSVISLYLNMGLANGVFLRTTIDNITGLLTDVRQRFLGTKAVKLVSLKIGGGSAVMALSTQPWLSFTYLSRTKLIPLSYEQLEHGSSFCSEQCPEGIVAISGNVLKILNVEKLGSVFNQVSIKLKYTPRRLLLDEISKNFIILESENGVYSEKEKQQILNKKVYMINKSKDLNDDGSLIEELDPEVFGMTKAGNGKWASCIRLLNPFSGETLKLIELEDNEAAVSMALCVFSQHPNERLLVIGTVKDHILAPKQCSKGFLKVYKFVNENNSLKLLQETEIDGLPGSLCAFQGRLLVGVGPILRIYDLGKKKLLRKCESKSFPRNIIKLQTQGDRIVATDAAESIQFASYRHFDNRIVIFADDPTPRFMTCSQMLDYDTAIGGDKFGTLFVNRLDQEISKAIAEDATGNLAMFERGFLQGAPHKLSTVCSYFVAETITSISRCILTPGGSEVILYTTLLGTIGVLIPFTSKSDVEFFQLLEMTLRQELSGLGGRNHMAFRGSFSPVCCTIDGDLCELFNQLGNEKKRQLAESLDRSVADIAKKLDDIRNRVAF